MATCIGPAYDEQGNVVEGACDRDPRAEGMCASHYRQALRCRERGKDVVLTPLRGYGENPLQSRHVRMSTACVKTLAEAAKQRPKATVSSIGREILERFARLRDLVTSGQREVAEREAAAFVDAWLSLPTPGAARPKRKRA